MNKLITEKNISDIINELSEEKILIPIKLSETMLSDEANMTFEYIETELNTIYDKIRLLEQLHNYTEVFVKEQIEKKENQFKEYLKTIEDVSDLYQDNNSVSYLIQFLASKDTIRDRDGSIIQQMDINNHSLEMPGTILAKANLNNIIHKSDIDCYNNTYNNLLKEKPGVSIYFADNPFVGGILEQVQTTISNPQTYNYIGLDITNAQLLDPTIVHESSSEPINIINGYINPTIVSGFNFNLNCVNYNIGKKANTINSPKTNIPINDMSIPSGTTTKEKEIETNITHKKEQVQDVKEKHVEQVTGTGEYIYTTYRPWVLGIKGAIMQKMSNGMYEPVGSFHFWNEDWRRFPEVTKIEDNQIMNKEKLENRITDKEVRYWVRKLTGHDA